MSNQINIIVIENTALASLLNTALTSDILPALETMTGSSWSTTTSDTGIGVVRVRTYKALANQQYRLVGAANSDLVIEGGSWRGCRHGLYALLKELGFYQLMPGTRWRITPSVSDVRRNLNINRSPSIESYSWSPQGSGAQGGAYPYGTKHIDAWYAFMRMNGTTQGHFVSLAGPLQTFGGQNDGFVYQARKSLFDANPTQLCQPYPDWRQNTEYGLGDMVSANGHWYSMSAAYGRSSASGSGPSGTGTGISDGTCTWSHASICTKTYPNWIINTSYAIGARCHANGNQYICVSAGTSANSGTGPSGAGTNISDGSGSLKWNYVSNPHRYTNIGYLHTTHEGHATSTNSTDYAGTSGGASIYALELGSRLDTVFAGLPAHPDLQDLIPTQSAAVGDGAPPDRSQKSLDLLRLGLPRAVEFSIDRDAKSVDNCLWRAGRIYEIMKAARPNKVFKISDYIYDRQSTFPTAGLPMNPNIHAIIVLYGYQGDGHARARVFDEYLDRRDLYGFTFGLYDYWSLPAWVLSDARFPISSAWNRTRMLAENNGTSLTTESTKGAGAAGLHVWGAHQLMWDPARTNAELLDEYCTIAFGAGATAMKRLFTRWWAQEWPLWIAHEYEFGLSFRDMKEADDAVVRSEEEDARSRIAAWMVYLVFLHYRKVWKDATTVSPAPSEEDIDALSANLLHWVHRTFSTYMIDVQWVHDRVWDSPRVSDAFQTAWHIPSGASAQTTWFATGPLAGVTDYTDDDIRDGFETIRALHAVPTPARFTTPDLTSFTRPYTPAGTTLLLENYQGVDEIHDTGCVFLFEVRTGATGILGFDMHSTTPEASTRITIRNALTGAVVLSNDYDIPRLLNQRTNYPHLDLDFDLSTFAPGFYYLRIENRAHWRITHRRANPLMRLGPQTRVIWSNSVGPAGTAPAYFFVPKNVTAWHIYWEKGSDPASKLRDGSDSLVTPVSIGTNVYRVDVPADQDKKVWRIEGTLPRRFLDIPEWTCSCREEIIIPTNLWTE